MPGNRPRAPGGRPSREAPPVSLPGAVGGVSGHPPGRMHGCNSNQDALRLDLETLRAEPARLDELPTKELLAVLERCEIERERLAVVERGALALLRDRVARQVDPHESDGDSFIPVKMAAERLGLDVKTIYRRRLPFIRELVPGTWRVSTRALARWMATRRRLDAG